MVVCAPGPTVFGVPPLEQKVSLFAGDGSGLPMVFRCADGAGGSSPKSRRLALPAAGELYLSWTDSGEGGTSTGGDKYLRLTSHTEQSCEQKQDVTHLYVRSPGPT